MTTLPLSTFWDTSKTEGEAKAGWFDKELAIFKELPGGAEAVSELTIGTSTEAITPIYAAHTVDTFGDAASDDLKIIDITNMPEGRRLLLRAANTARTVVLKHEAGGSGQISLKGGADLSLDDDTKWIELILIGTIWEEIERFRAGTSTGDLVPLVDVDGGPGLPAIKGDNLTGVFLKSLLTAAGDIIYASGAGTPAVLAKSATDGKLLSLVSGLPAWVGGRIVQLKYNEYSTYASTASWIPYDETPPQIGEGAQILTVSMDAPKHADNLLVFFGSVHGHVSTAAVMTVAGYRDGSTSAIFTSSKYIISHAQTLSFFHQNAAGSTTAQTWTINAGPSAGVLYFNGDAGSRMYGGTLKAVLIGMEVSL